MLFPYAEIVRFSLSLTKLAYLQEHFIVMDNCDVEIRSGLLVCLSICAADGFVSLEEEEALQRRFIDDLNVTEIDFKDIVNVFFDDKAPIEIYLKGVQREELRRNFLEIAKEAAAADGLDITENIAWKKCKILWGFDYVASS
jgi:hypothetical protein